MEIYYAVKVKMVTEDDNGQDKRVQEYALVPAISVSDAETKVVKHYVDFLQYRDVTVISAGPSQIVTVVGISDGDKIIQEEKNV